jgi:hypothetical protein
MNTDELIQQGLKLDPEAQKHWYFSLSDEEIAQLNDAFRIMADALMAAAEQFMEAMQLVVDAIVEFAKTTTRHFFEAYLLDKRIPPRLAYAIAWRLPFCLVPVQRVWQWLLGPPEMPAV